MSRNTYVLFHFVSQEELKVSEEILLPYTKVIVRVSYLLAVFEKFTKIELADNTARRCQRYKMKKHGAFHQILATLAKSCQK